MGMVPMVEGCVKPTGHRIENAMKEYLRNAISALGLLALGLIVGSCADTSSSSDTHQMGPPGKEHPVSDEAHPGMAR